MLNEKGYVEAQVQVQPDEGDFISNIKIHSLLLEGFREYAAQVAEIHAMEGVFDTAIRTDSIESTSEQIRVYSSMMLNHRGHLKAEAGFNPLQPGHLRLDLTVADFLLSDLNIYSRYYTGFPVM